ncbi:tyrosinase family protein [Flavobacterium humi]|uniref:Tyrosinase family protein n=1 Tax=Flavobacterium humi TaxID=2562683 RepID=A0A4Z0L9R6_9FLAO|nr:tyrosinase family protein [Flavobacterium humi]TGD57930.1 tyrosinase family protein [Flavobacterium humi]
MKHYYFIFCCVIMVLFANSCAVIPTCPNSRMPIIEIQVNNTESNHDDYIGTSGFIQCRARITNFNKDFGSGLQFPGGVEVEFRNKRLSSDLFISTTNSGVTTSFFTTLPGNGGWFNFFVKGNSLSAADKASIIEIATAGASCNEVVIARKGLMVSSSPGPIPNTRPQVAIEVGSITTIDDYIAWNPVSCRIKWLNPSAPGATLNITLRNMPSLNRLRFATGTLAAGTTATNLTENLTLSGDGSWASFKIAGNQNNASVEDKDAVFEVMQGADLLAREAVMVRIRKNANTLSTPERDRYLEALREIHQTYNFYELFKNSHSGNASGFNVIAHRQAHVGSAFLPWHRAFMLHIERILQASDPSVALPYWHFDMSSPNMFNADFMGANPTAPAAVAIINPSNPISTWQITGQAAGIRRRTPYGNNGIPSSVMGTGTGVATEAATFALGANYSSFKGMEGTTHNGAHNNSGNSVSWIAGSPHIAPQDPLFYFLHGNIERLWAKWQWLNNRFDATQSSTYDLQGGHSNSPSSPPVFTTNPGNPNQITSNRTFGQYVEDSLWPWDNKTGVSQGTGTLERPATAPLTPFPIVVGSIFPGAQPTIKTTIDFRLMNYGYDDFFPY